MWFFLLIVCVVFVVIWTNGKFFCIIDGEELRGPCKLIGKKKIKIGESIDVICEQEEYDFYTSPVETVDVIFE